MKKLVTSAAALCFVASSAFAAPTAVRVAPKGETRIQTAPGASIKPVPGKLGTVPARANVGAAAANENLLTEAARGAIVADKLGANCGSNSPVVGMPGALTAALASAKARGLSGDTCLKKFAEDKAVADRAARMIAAGDSRFTSLGITDVNGDGKTDVNDMTTAQKASVLDAQSDVMEKDLSVAEAAALDRMEGTVEQSCDIVTGTLGSAAAFQAARTN